MIFIDLVEFALAQLLRREMVPLGPAPPGTVIGKKEPLRVALSPASGACFRWLSDPWIYGRPAHAQKAEAGCAAGFALPAGCVLLGRAHDQ